MAPRNQGVTHLEVEFSEPRAQPPPPSPVAQWAHVTLHAARTIIISANKMQALRNHLGHSVTPQKTVGPAAFVVEDTDIEKGEISTWANFAQLDDLSEYESRFHAKFSAGININYYGYGSSGQVKGTHDKSFKKSGAVLSIASHQPFQLKNKFPHLEAAPYSAGLCNIGVSYITSGELACGFHVILSTEVRTDGCSFSGDLDISATIKVIQAGIEAGRNSKKSKSRKQRGVQLKGFGGYSPPAELMAMSFDSLEQSLKKIYNHFHDFVLEKGDMLHGGSFFYNEDCIEQVEQKCCLEVCSLEQKKYVNLVQGNHGTLMWSNEEEPYIITVSPCQVLGITESIWETDCFMYLNQLDEDNEEVVKYFQIVGKDPQLLLQNEDDGDEDLTENFQPTRWKFRRGQFAKNKEVERFLCGVVGKPSSETWWTIASPGGAGCCRVCLVDKRSSTRQLVCLKKVDPRKQQLADCEHNSDEPTLEAGGDMMMKEAKLSDDEGMEYRDVRLVEDFVDRIFPKLVLSRREDLVIFLGNTGAGKSAFINALLGHIFTTGFTLEGEESVGENTAMLGKYFDVVDKSRPYAAMGTSNFVSTTSEPDMYTTTEKHSGHKETLADLPGFSDSEGRDSFNTFGMFMLKELAHSIKAVVVVISYAEIISAKGPAFLGLVKTLNKIFSIKPPELRENLIFVVNMKLAEVKDAKYEIWGLIRDFECHCNCVLTNFRKKCERIKNVIPRLTETQRKHFQNKCADWQCIIRDCEDLLDTLNLITPDNMIVWQSFKDTSVRELVWEKLERCNGRTMSKEHMRFELDRSNVQEKWRLFDRYILIYYLKHLQKLDADVTHDEDLIESHRRSITLLRTDQSNAFASIKEEKMKIQSLKRDVEIAEVDFKDYCEGVVIVETEDVPETYSGLFRGASYKKRFAPEDRTRYTHYSVTSKSKKRYTTSGGDVGKKPKREEDGSIKTHESATVSVTRSLLWFKIPKNDAQITINSARRFCESYENQIQRMRVRIDRMLLDVTRREDNLRYLEQQQDVEGKVRDFSNEIESLQRNVKKLRAMIESEREENVRVHNAWLPVYEVLANSILSKQRSLRGRYISYPNIRKFLSLCQKWYPEDINEGRLDDDDACDNSGNGILAVEEDSEVDGEEGVEEDSELDNSNGEEEGAVEEDSEQLIGRSDSFIEDFEALDRYGEAWERLSAGGE